MEVKTPNPKAKKPAPRKIPKNKGYNPKYDSVIDEALAITKDLLS